MVRDGLAYLPDCFTSGDMSDIVIYLCTCWLSTFKPLCLFFCPAVSDCTFLCTVYSVMFIYIFILLFLIFF